MNKKKTLLAVILTLVLLLGGAYFLYGKLSRNVSHDQLATQSGTQSQDDGGSKTGEDKPDDSEAGEDEPDGGEDDEGESDGGETGEDEPEKTPAPDFTVYDRDNNEVRLSDYVGKPVVLNFWASWCGPCQSEMPDFDEAYAELGEDIHFLMVNMTTSGRESFENATSFLDEQGYSFPVCYDLDGDAATTYGVYSLPTTYFIDAEGNAVAWAAGALDRETLDKGIGMITEQE